jgi:DNA-binding response OmpR family regulator
VSRVLIAEDEEDLADIWRRAIETDGHHVDMVADGEDAVEKLKSESYDLVITDLHMPRKGGLVVTGMARVHQSDIKIILVTGRYDRLKSVNVLDIAESLGADRALQKPIDLQNLSDTIRSLLNA